MTVAQDHKCSDKECRWRMVCSECGGADVQVKAWVSWLEAEQKWGPAEEVPDEDGWCEDCESNTTIIAVCPLTGERL